MAIWNYYHDAISSVYDEWGEIVGIQGEEPGVKTPKSHPYSYDPFTIWKNGVKPSDAVYSDRLLGWDHKKHNELCKKHFSNQGQDWSRRDPSRIERFLRDYFDSPPNPLRGDPRLQCKQWAPIGSFATLLTHTLNDTHSLLDAQWNFR